MITKPEPRILVVAEFPPGASGGDWVAIKQHFRGLDWSQISWWCFFASGPANSRVFGGRYSRCGIPPKLQPQVRWNSARAWILENIAVRYASFHLLSYIDSVKPDLIFLMTRGWMIPLAHRVMPKTKAHWHMALHDMPDTDGMVRTQGRARTDRFNRMTDDLYRQASSRSVISPAMAEDMRQRTGVECSDIFRCSVEPEAIARLREPAPKPAVDVIRIGYAGVIIAEATFVLLVKALQAIRGQLSRRVEIHLYGFQRYGDREWFDPELIIEHGFISDKELDEHYRSGTWGLALMHLDEVDPRYNHFSFPCKFAMSLSSGVPLICIGHRKTPLMQMARDYNLGLTFTETDTEALAEGLRQGLENFSCFDKFRGEILRCALTEFNAERNRQRLHQFLDAAATRPR